MANYSHAKEIIAANVYTNHDGKVTAEKAKTAINEVVNTLIAGGYLYAGVAHPGDAAVSPDANVFYIASEAGTYTNKGGLVVADGEVAIFKFNGTWSKEVTGAATAAQVTELGQEIGTIASGTEKHEHALFGGSEDITALTYTRGGLGNDGYTNQSNSLRAQNDQFFIGGHTITAAPGYKLLRVYEYELDGTYIAYTALGSIASYTYTKSQRKARYVFVKQDGTSFAEVHPTGLISSLVYSKGIVQQLNGLSFWKGTQAQYDALGTYDPNTVYFVY